MGSTLPEGLDAFLKAQVASGAYQSEEEVYQHGLRLLKAQKEDEAEKLKQLRQDIALGESQLDRGEGLPFDVDQIVAMGRERQKS